MEHGEHIGHTETEAKFTLDWVDQVDRILKFLRDGGIGITGPHVINIADIYWDTVEWDLFRSGWAYRWKDADGRLRIGLKSLEKSKGAVQRRREIEQDVLKLPEGHADLPPGPVSDLVGEILNGTEPRFLFAIDKERTRYLVTVGDNCEVELCFDDTHMVSSQSALAKAGDSNRFLEMEIELLTGDAVPLAQLAEQLISELGLRPSKSNKFERGLRFANLNPPGWIQTES